MDDKNFIDAPTYIHAYLCNQPLYIDGIGNTWTWNTQDKTYIPCDDTNIINNMQVFTCTNNPIIKPSYFHHTRAKIIRTIKDYSQLSDHKVLDLPKHMVQFKGLYFNITDRTIQKATPKYFCANILPFSPKKGKETPVIDKLLTEWVGSKHVPTMKEILAYCMRRSQDLQIVFYLVGCGRNGKSTFLELIDRFIGENNVTTADLERLEKNVFESSSMYKKLVCNVTETDYAQMKSIRQLKILSGGDKMSFQAKYKDSIHDYNYAKILIASNSLPLLTDQSDGAMRRLFVIDFPNNFDKQNGNILDTIPEHEWHILSYQCCDILPNLLKSGYLTNDMTLEERREKYNSMSNPIPTFLKDECEQSTEYSDPQTTIYQRFVHWCKENRRRTLDYNEFRELIVMQGFEIERERTEIGNYQTVIHGIGLKKKKVKEENV